MGTAGLSPTWTCTERPQGRPSRLLPSPPSPLYRMSALGAVLYSVWNGGGGGRGEGWAALSPFRGFSAFGLLLLFL